MVIYIRARLNINLHLAKTVANMHLVYVPWASKKDQLEVSWSHWTVTMLFSFAVVYSDTNVSLKASDPICTDIETF